MRVGTAASRVAGVDPRGAEIAVDVDGLVALVFLTSSCRPCQPYWRAGSVAAPVAFVTPDPSTEDRRRVVKLAAYVPGLPVAMSTAAWLAYHVTKAPWLVIVERATVVVDQPAPASPAEVLVMLDRLPGRTSS
jgi:hypothetical protein